MKNLSKKLICCFMGISFAFGIAGVSMNKKMEQVNAAEFINALYYSELELDHFSKDSWSTGEKLTTKDIFVNATISDDWGGDDKTFKCTAYDVRTNVECGGFTVACFNETAPSTFESFISDDSELQTEVTLLEGSNNFTLYVYTLNTNYIDEYSQPELAITLTFTINTKLTAEGLASEFNDAMELNCDEHGNTSSTNLENIKTAWENAASQYKTLDTTELSKINLFEGDYSRYQLTYSFDNDESNQEIKLIESQQFLGAGYDFDFCYLNSIEENNLSIAKGSVGLKNNSSSFKINFNSQYMKLLNTEIGVTIASSGGGGGGGGGSGGGSVAVSMFLDFYGKNKDNDEVGYFSNIQFANGLSSGTKTYFYPKQTMIKQYDIYELKSLELKCTSGSNPKISKIFFTADFRVPNIAEMIEKYDYIYTKYGTELELDNFLSRDVTPLNAKNNIINEAVTSTSWIVVAISLVGVTSIGAFFIYRKRKEN